MKNTKTIITTLLELFLYIIFISGIFFLLLVLGKASPELIKWKLIFILTHKILGYIFLLLIFWHCLINRKWYKAWISGKIKNRKISLLTKWISILFLIMLFSFFFNGIFPRTIYATSHAILGITWMVLTICHIKKKRNISKKTSRNYIPNATS